MISVKAAPALLQLYDFSKSGSDIIYQYMGMFSVNTKSKRWTIGAFSYMLDAFRINSQIIFATSKTIDPRSLEQFTFAFDISKTTLYKSTAYCNQTKMEFILSNLQVDEERATTAIPLVPDTSAEKRARCNICLRKRI